MDKINFTFVPILIDDFFFDLLSEQFYDDTDFSDYIFKKFEEHKNKYTVAKFTEHNAFELIVRDYDIFDSYEFAKEICKINN